MQVDQSGFRSQAIIVATTLLDAGEVTASDLAELYSGYSTPSQLTASQIDPIGLNHAKESAGQRNTIA